MDGNDLLSKLRLGLYSPLKLIFCPACAISVPKDRVLSHVTFKHRLVASTVRQVTDEIETKVDALGSDEMASVHSSKGPALKFLNSPRKGFRCGSCMLLHLSETSMCRHLKVSGYSRESGNIAPSVQVIYREVGKQSVLYEVLADTLMHQPAANGQPDPVPFDSGVSQNVDWVIEYLERSRIKESILCNTAELYVRMTPWLIFTNWACFFEGEDLSNMAEKIPSLKNAKQEFPELIDALNSIFYSGKEVLGQLSPEMRLLLQGQEGKSVSKPIRKVGSDTFARYTTPMVQLIVMMVSGAEYNTLEALKFDTRYIPPCVYTLSQYLFSAQSNTDPPDIKKTFIVKLCRSILNHLTHTALVNKFSHSPISVFMAYLGLETRRGVCTFKEAFGYTSTISAFLYVVRMIIVENVIHGLMLEYPRSKNQNHFGETAAIL